MANDKKRKKRKPAQIQTDVRIFGRGDPSNRNEGKFKVSKGVEKAADKVRARRTSKKLDKVDESLRVKDQKLPTKVRIPKSKVRGPSSASAKSDSAQNAFRSTSKSMEKRDASLAKGDKDKALKHGHESVRRAIKAGKDTGKGFGTAIHKAIDLKRTRKRKKKQDK